MSKSGQELAEYLAGVANSVSPDGNVFLGGMMRILGLGTEEHGELSKLSLEFVPGILIGRALRLRGLGRKLGPLKGDLYLRLMAL